MTSIPSRAPARIAAPSTGVASTFSAVVAICALNSLVFNRFSTGYVPTEEQLAAVRGQYKRVLIIGVDGMGDYVRRMEEGSMPNYDKLFGGFTTAGGTKTLPSFGHMLSKDDVIDIYKIAEKC